MGRQVGEGRLKVITGGAGAWPGGLLGGPGAISLASALAVFLDHSAATTPTPRRWWASGDPIFLGYLNRVDLGLVHRLDQI